MEVPCKDCIVLAMCKARISKTDSLTFYKLGIDGCPLVKSWLFDKGESESRIKFKLLNDFYEIKKKVILNVTKEVIHELEYDVLELDMSKLQEEE